MRLSLQSQEVQSTLELGTQEELRSFRQLTDLLLSLQDQEIRDLLLQLLEVPLVETISRIEAVEMSLVTANKEKLTLMDSAERHLSISVQVHHMRKVSSQQHVNRAAWSINQDMMLVNDLQERSDGLKVMSCLSLLKSGHTMKAL